MLLFLRFSFFFPSSSSSLFRPSLAISRLVLGPLSLVFFSRRFFFIGGDLLSSSGVLGPSPLSLCRCSGVLTGASALFSLSLLCSFIFGVVGWVLRCYLFFFSNSFFEASALFSLSL
uniref:Uncharacterized protein n=1 Tax=Opuntia streptacantha TaxID=393608 RepID=A0A7C8Z786_OPUST